MRRASLAWLAAMVAAVALVTEWMRQPGWILAAGLLALGAVALAAALWHDGHRTAGGAARVAGAALALGLAVVVTALTRDLDRLRHDWPAVREALVRRASARLDADLGAAFRDARALADRAASLLGGGGGGGAAAPAASDSAGRDFRRLAALVRRRGPARGVVLFDSTGRPEAWAGVQRVPLNPSGPELSTVTTPFYVWLVARRQAHGGSAAADILLARSSYAPPGADAVADRFAAETGVGLRFYAPGGAPAGDSDVFDYIWPPPPAAGDTLFAVETQPPEQDAAITARLSASRRVAFWGVLALLLVAIIGAVQSGAATAGVLAAGGAAFLFVARAPLAEAFGPGSMFSAATYYQDVLGPFSASAGHLILAGLVVALLASALWRRGMRPRWPNWLAALGVTVLAPYLLQDLARGVTPPASGVTLSLFLTWQVALLLSAAALVLTAAALVRGPAVPRQAGRWPILAAVLAIALALTGLFLWRPHGAWPEWYAYLWLPALLVAIRPMPFRGTIATVAIVAGSAAALLEWRATVESRVDLATRDMDGLGDRADALKVALFDRLVRGVSPASRPETAGDLYLLWRRSDFAVHGYPAALSLWSAANTETVALDLARLDLPTALVAGQVDETLDEGVPLVRSYLRTPGVYGLATIPLSDGRVVAVGVGPQSVLVAPTRVGSFLAAVGGEAGGVGGGAEPAAPPYRLTLAPPEPRGPPPASEASWTRVGWTIRGERAVRLPGGARHVHGQVDLGNLSDLLQRGLLLLVLDVGVLAGLWLLVDVLGGRFVADLRAWWPTMRSLRSRLTVVLAAFFVLPTVGFALWSYGTQGDQFRRSRELLIDRTLQDAGAALEPDSTGLALGLGDVAQRVGAELVLSRGGVLRASSAPVLADLGLVDWLLPPSVYTRLVYGDYIELTDELADAPQPVMVGYRLLQSSDLRRASVLSSLQLLRDRTLTGREADLSIAVLVAAVLGIVAALFLSGAAARALARPLGDLAHAALVAGSGERPAPAAATLPSELEPVYRAIEQAAADVERGQQANRVLAWGEMARQVTHEIKNPLTPIRLGIQHLMRVRRERPAELDAVLDVTGPRVLAEIDRLDAIARAFSRFALPSPERPPVEPVALDAVLREVVRLYQLGESPVRWNVEVPPGVVVQARRDELAEVLVNLLENARDAGASRVDVRASAARGVRDGAPERVVVEVQDDGRGIPDALLPRVFEPRFSTTTSGSGLGLAIAKRLVEGWGWGSTIAIASEPGRGTTVRLDLAGPAPRAPAAAGR